MFTVDLTNKHVVMDRDYVDSYRNRTGPHQNGMWMQYNESKVRSSAGRSPCLEASEDAQNLANARCAAVHVESHPINMKSTDQAAYSYLNGCSSC